MQRQKLASLSRSDMEESGMYELEQSEDEPGSTRVAKSEALKDFPR